MKLQALAALLALALLCPAARAEAGDTSRVAGAEDMTEVMDIVDESLTPVTAEQLKDGVYPVRVESSSSMFKVLDAELTVSDGEMTARLRMKSEAYSYMYPGPAEEAARAPLEALAALETEGGEHFFTLPVEALDAGYTCAAFSARKQIWYPRTLVFHADSLPLEAWRAECLVTARSLSLADGEYACAVRLEGKGKARLESPARLTVAEGVCTAEIAFSTAKIDYVLVGGEKYLPVNAEGNAAFWVPVACFDRMLEIIVDTTAVKPAAEVPYSVIFESASIQGWR